MRFLTTVFACVLVTGAVALADGSTVAVSDADAKPKIEDLKTALKTGDVAAKKKAIEAAASCAHPGLAGMLAQVGGTDAADELRIAAADALGKMRGLTDAARALHAIIGSNLKKPVVLTAIFKAIGGVGDKSSIAICRGFATERMYGKDDTFVAPVCAAIDALGTLRWKDAVDGAIGLRGRVLNAGAGMTGPAKQAIQTAVERTIDKLIGQTQTSQEEMEKWWKRHASEYNEDLTKRPRGYYRGNGDNGNNGDPNR